MAVFFTIPLYLVRWVWASTLLDTGIKMAAGLLAMFLRPVAGSRLALRSRPC